MHYNKSLVLCYYKTIDLNTCMHFSYWERSLKPLNQTKCACAFRDIAIGKTFCKLSVVDVCEPMEAGKLL